MRRFDLRKPAKGGRALQHPIHDVAERRATSSLPRAETNAPRAAVVYCVSHAMDVRTSFADGQKRRPPGLSL